MKNRPARLKLNLSRETLQRLEGDLSFVQGGESRWCTATSSSCSEPTCILCTLPATHCLC